MEAEDLAKILSESSRQMHAGLHHLERGQWESALQYFDSVVALRNQLPWEKDGSAAWMLAAAWINRGDALIGLQREDLLPEILRSFDQTIEAMHRVPLSENPAYAERLILAWLKRAACCGDYGKFDEALRNFSTADDLLEQWGRAISPTRTFLEAMLLVNRARVELEMDRPQEARDSSKKATELLRQLNTPAAMVKAWSIQCRSLALILDREEDVGETWIADATDAVDEALALVKSTGRLEGWEADLVRYGAKIYRVCQPQFLSEFLSDWILDGPMANDAKLREQMLHEVMIAKFELENRVLAASLASDYVQGQIVILKSLQAIEQRLSQA